MWATVRGLSLCYLAGVLTACGQEPSAGGDAGTDAVLEPPAAICGNGIIESGTDYSGTDELCDTNGSDPDVFPADTAAGSTCSPTCVAIAPPIELPPSECGNGVIESGPDYSGVDEACDTNGADIDVLPDDTAVGSTCNEDCSAIDPPVAGPCLACVWKACITQYNDALGNASSAENVADITQLFACVIGPDWALGGAIPQTSCFFADPEQPLGSLVPCYCGSTPQDACLSTGPIDHGEACGVEVELASDCDPVSSSCVIGNGSNPLFPLGDALQLLNCERAYCPTECGFPPPPKE